MAPFGEGSSSSGGVQNSDLWLMKTSALSIGAKFTLLLMLFLKSDSMVNINDTSTYPTIFPNIFSSLWRIWTSSLLTMHIFLFAKWTYLFLLLYLPGVQIKLMNSFITLPMLDQLSRLSSLTGFHSLIYNMKFKNDQIRIRQSDLSCICGIKDKLHTNVILQQKETRQAGLRCTMCFSSLASLFGSVLGMWNQNLSLI